MGAASPARAARGAAARRAGRRAEWLALAFLMLRGWRILGFRLRTTAGEIDILAARRGVLAVVEVKARPSLAEAADAVRHTQHQRLLRAGQAVQRARRSLAGHALRLDLLVVAPGPRLRHLPDAWPSREGL